MLLYKKMYGQNLGALCASQPPLSEKGEGLFCVFYGPMYAALCMDYCV